MRRVSLFLFLVLGSLLVVTAPARAETAQYYALSFDGVDDYVKIENTNILMNEWSWTLVILFKGTGTLIAKYGVGEDEDLNAWLLRVQDDGDIEFNYEYGAGLNRALVFNTKLNTAEWHLIVLKRFNSVASNVTSVRLYVDGEEVGYLSDVAATGGESATYFYIGHSIGIWFKGEIGLVAAYGLLSPEQIEQVFENPLQPPEGATPVLFYAPDSVDTANNKWLDKSGRGNDGTIVGASYVPLRPVSESTPSASAPYGLYFDGVDDYVGVADSPDFDFQNEMSIVILFRAFHKDSSQMLISKGYNANPNFAVWITSSGNIVYWRRNDTIGSESTVAAVSDIFNSSKMVTIVHNHPTVKIYDGATLIEESNSAQVSPADCNNDYPLQIARAVSGFFLNGKIYLVLIYSRALSDSEIQAIYNDPLHPPTDGLVLWYSPYTYDPVSGKWLNIAPIFPTIPLSEELDATNYGATPERISIPRVQAYDATNNSEISVYNLTVKTTNGETFIPWFMPLPYNQTLTLNVSAVGYKPSIVSVQAPIDNLVFYLYPSQVITSWERPELNVNLDNITADEYLPDASKDIDKFSSLFTRWLGGEYFKWLLSLDLEGMLKDFFNNPPIPGLGILLALMIWAGAVLMTWLYFEEPEPVFVEGNIVYFGLMQFIDVSPGILAVPLGVFILFLGYKQLYKALKVWARR